MANNCKHTKCGTCGGIKLKRVFIGKTINQVCSGKCLAASKDACECKCKGKFHAGQNTRLLKSVLRPKKKAVKKVVKKVEKVVEKVKKAVKKVKTKTPFFEPQNIKDEVALFIQGKRFLTKSFDRFNDRNLRRDQKTLALNWLSSKGQSLDVAALDFLNLTGYDFDESYIIDLITEIILDYPSGIKQYIKDAILDIENKKEAEIDLMKQNYYSRTDYNDFDLEERVRLEDEEYFKNYKEPALMFGVNNMKLKKGSAAAKAFMAKIRAKKGTTKKVGTVSKIKKLSKAKEARLNYLQKLEDNDNLTSLQNKEYNKLVLEYRKTDAYKNKQKSKRGDWSLADKKQLALELGEDFYNAADWKKLTGKTKTVKKISGWKKGNTRMIEKGEKPFKTKKTVLVKRRIVTKPKGTFKKFTTIISGLFDTKTINDLDDLKQEYRKLANKYHPDKGGTTAQFQELQNEYEKLRNKILSGSSLSEAEKENEIVIDEALRAAINAIITLEGINIELIGKWIWVSGNTFPVYPQIKAAGFEFIKKKNVPYWIYKGVESKSRGGTDMADIVKKYGSKPIKPTGSSGKKLSGVKTTVSATQKSKLKTALNKLVKAMNKRPL